LCVPRRKVKSRDLQQAVVKPLASRNNINHEERETRGHLKPGVSKRNRKAREMKKTKQNTNPTTQKSLVWNGKKKRNEINKKKKETCTDAQKK
jgi:hypothetical protein